MTLTQALALARLLIEFELETPAVTPPPPEWRYELNEAKKALDQAIARPPAGDFFLSALVRRKKEKIGG